MREGRRYTRIRPEGLTDLLCSREERYTRAKAAIGKTPERR